MPVLRELVSRLIVKDKQATGTLAKHDKQIKKTKRSLLELNAGLELVQKGFGFLRTAVRGASRAFDFLIADVATLGDKFAKEGKKIGITATSLQELSFAAERAGADGSKLTKAFAKMGKSLDDIRVRGTGPLADQFDVLGIKFEDFEGLSPEETFGKLADVIASIEDPMKRSAVAQDIFGRSGRELIPLLIEGSQGIEALRERARELGLSMSDEAAAGSEVFVDAMTDLKASVQGARFEIGAKLIPLATEYVTMITDWVVANKALLRVKVIDFVRDLIDVTKALAGILKTLIDNWRTLAALLVGAKLVGALTGAKTLITGLGMSATASAGAMRMLSLSTGALGVALIAGAVILDQTEKAIDRMRAQTQKLIADVIRAKQKIGGMLAGESLEELRARKAETVATMRGEGFSEGQIKEFLATSGLGAALEAKQRLVEDKRIRQIEGREKRAAEGFARARAAREAKGKGRRGGGRGRGRGGGKAGGGRRIGQGAPTPTAPTTAAPTDADLLALAAAAIPGADLGAITAGRRVPTAPAPVVTVTVNQTNVDVDVNSPISIEGVAEMNLEQLANAITERQGSELDSAVRSAIEAIQPEAVR